jgi:hypothetical protein
LIQGLLARAAQHFFQPLVAGQNQLTAGLAAAHDSGNQPQLVHQLLSQAMGIIDGAKQSIGTVRTGTQVVSQLQPQFTLAQFAVGLSDLEQNVLQQILARVRSGAGDCDYLKMPGVAVGQEIQQQRFAGSRTAKNDRGPRLTFDRAATVPKRSLCGVRRMILEDVRRC